MTKKGKKDHRFTFTLPHQQLDALRQIAGNTGLAVADHIRRALSDYLRKIGGKSQ